MKRKYILIIIVLLVGFISCSTEKKEEKNIEAYREEFKKYANDYLVGLKAVLKRNIKNGGPYNGVTVCADTASDLTDMFSEAIELDVKRVSFKNRNPKNVPDEMEAKILHEYEVLLKKNKLTKNTETFGKYVVNGKEVIRYMKPIVIEEKCLKCHGKYKNIAEDIRFFLKAKYPNDKAIDYSVGDLRGAVSITKVL